MKTLRSPLRTLIMAFLTLSLALPAFGQTTHSNLKDPEQLKRFKHISESLMCACGCRMVLEHCNHSVCIAWTMRDVIDKLILAGKSDNEIIEGFIEGFGESAYTDPAFSKVRAEGNENLMMSFANGFGEYHRSYPKGKNPEIMIILFTVAGMGAALLFLRSRMRRLKAQSDTPEKKDTKNDAEKEELYKHLYDD